MHTSQERQYQFSILSPMVGELVEGVMGRGAGVERERYMLDRC